MSLGGIDWKFDHCLGVSYCRQLAYLFDLDDGSHVRIEVDGHLYVSRVAPDGRPTCEPRMFVVNRRTCDHAEARMRAVLDSKEAHRVAWELFWDIVVIPAFEGKDGHWLANTFDPHAERWFRSEIARRERSASSVLES